MDAMKRKLLETARRGMIVGLVLAAGGWIFVRWGNDIGVALENGRPSRSLGTTKAGRLINGKRLPSSGVNFRAYGGLPTAAGRNA